jgi:hypothetical protein
LATSAEVWVIVIGILRVAALVYAQVVLRRLRRRLNPAIAGATVVALAVLVLVPIGNGLVLAGQRKWISGNSTGALVGGPAGLFGGQ